MNDITQDCLTFLREQEGCRLTAYPDPATKAEPYTIGVGSTHYNDGSPVKKGDVITTQMADEMLKFHIEKFISPYLNKEFPKINSNQFSSLVSFSYNLGIGILERPSCELKRLILEKGSNDAILAQFLLYDQAAHKVNASLLSRRKREATLFLKPV